MDVSLRGAVSIARRLQDPLAELVKIDPKSIGVGQYQHDLSEIKLSRSLDAVVEDCVNAVGVDVNTASVAAAGPGLRHQRRAGREHRRAPRRQRAVPHPRRRSRTCRGSARRRSSSARASCASPAATTRSTPPACTPRPTRWCGGSSAAPGGDMHELIGNTAVLRALRPQDFVDDTLRPADRHRHPRASWRSRAATRARRSRPRRFAEGVETLGDLAPGMVLEGVVTNVAAFGAFVDVGVHQDGLVHVSAMSRTFVTDPREVVKPGDVVRVKVLDVDIPRKRISLTLRLDDETSRPWAAAADARGGPGPAGASPSGNQPSGTSREAARKPGGAPGRGGPRGGGRRSAAARTRREPGPRAPGARAPGPRGRRPGRVRARAAGPWPTRSGGPGCSGTSLSRPPAGVAGQAPERPPGQGSGRQRS